MKSRTNIALIITISSLAVIAVLVGVAIFCFLIFGHQPNGADFFDDRLSDEALPLVSKQYAAVFPESLGRTRKDAVATGRVAHVDELLQTQPFADCEQRRCTDWQRNTNTTWPDEPANSHMPHGVQRTLAAMKGSQDARCVVRFAPNREMGGTATTRYSERDILCVKPSGDFVYTHVEL